MAFRGTPVAAFVCSLVVTSELRQLADGCLLVTRARRLVDWVGEGKPVTPKGVLRPVDVAAAGTALGVTVPAWVRTAADVEVVHRPWVAAEAIGWLRVSANRAVADSATEDDPVQRWWAAVRAVLRTESHDDRGRGAPILLRTLLTVMTAQSPPEMKDIPEAVHELLHYFDLGDASAVYSAFRRSVMPVDAGLELLGEVGAVDGDRRVTELGRWMWQRLLDEWPPPLSPDAPASAVLERLATLPGDGVWRQAGPWLAEREMSKAAAELLDAAATAPPAQRIVAVDVVAGLGEAALPAWQQAAEVPTLAAHARLVLAEFEDEDEDEDEPAEPDPADLRWLAVEYAAAALAVDGPREAFLVLRERGGLDAPGSGHPDEAVLRDGLAELIAAGGPPIPTYQLKITLTRVRPPVWRRVRLPATATLDELHRVIQIVFDWDDDHLHVFTVDGRRYADPFFGLEETADEFRARLGRLAPNAGSALTYVYDLGDRWEHRILVERIIETEQPETSAVCVGGQGDAPEEDWFPGCGRDATPFDLAAINERLSGTAPR
ncbi:plasmid pRiA4b ORF-3 family protein [Paractinoplanes hotanensis]|uniref:Plasmid pRiA4b ORF-3 family protein n=1 Tax=Paractinoplanes hotanensis TaxID=2906497 RepID=A0ABT0YGG0_9ACTN|nr:plasmid pRiA4b ORF-3 family protein [Actinoplanes hotanensis]MCM4084572.1 plasmid pRiA4b ORF-3 family protein [Actinoplanes hotanensis]